MHAVAMLERDAGFLHDKKANKKASLNYFLLYFVVGAKTVSFSSDYFVMIV